MASWPLNATREEAIVPWFKPFGHVFRPASIAGWTLSLIALAFCVHIFVFVDSRSHSVSDTFYGIFPYWVPTSGYGSPAARAAIAVREFQAEMPRDSAAHRCMKRAALG
jgi:hypothetical protein